MNRAARYMIEEMSKEMFGRILAMVIDQAPGSYVTNKEFHEKQGNYCSPTEVVSWALRRMKLYEVEEEKVSIWGIKNMEDPYGVVTNWFFCNEFKFKPKLGGFAPLFEEREHSRWYFKAYKEIEEELIKAEWRTFSHKLFMQDDTPVKLIHKFSKPHVYFMQAVKDGSIKIGASIHPEIRRKQIRYQKKQDLRILGIIPSGGYELEKELHEKFRERNIKGEWFKPSDEIIEYLEQAVAS